MVLIKNQDQKTFLAWPVHLYANCLQLLVSAGPTKCLGHLPQDGSHCWSSYRRQAEPHHAHGWWHSSGPGKGWSTKAHLRLYFDINSTILTKLFFKIYHRGGASTPHPPHIQTPKLHCQSTDPREKFSSKSRTR